MAKQKMKAKATKARKKETTQSRKKTQAPHQKKKDVEKKGEKSVFFEDCFNADAKALGGKKAKNKASDTTKPGTVTEEPVDIADEGRVAAGLDLLADKARSGVGREEQHLLKMIPAAITTAVLCEVEKGGWGPRENCRFFDDRLLRGSCGSSSAPPAVLAATGAFLSARKELLEGGKAVLDNFAAGAFSGVNVGTLARRLAPFATGKRGLAELDIKALGFAGGSSLPFFLSRAAAVFPDTAVSCQAVMTDVETILKNATRGAQISDADLGNVLLKILWELQLKGHNKQNFLRALPGEIMAALAVMPVSPDKVADVGGQGGKRAKQAGDKADISNLIGDTPGCIPVGEFKAMADDEVKKFGCPWRKKTGCCTNLKCRFSHDDSAPLWTPGVRL
jgi:hypothetical protein